MPDLSGLPALDLAIGLAFIYLLLSLLCSAIQEAISALFQLRAKKLESGLRNMLLHETKPDEAEDAVTAFFAHPLIRGVSKKRWWRKRLRLPSYIAPRAFSLALLDTVAPPPTGAKANYNMAAALDASITKYDLPNAVKSMLRRFLEVAQEDTEAARRELEQWFDDTMARVSGWYKRQAQLILAGIAVVVTLALNVNTLTLAETLWKDPTVRAAVVAQSAKATQQPKGANPQDRLKSAANDVDGLRKLGLPLGWPGKVSGKTEQGQQDSQADPRRPRNALWAAGGWLLTIIALSLGAPFWFDALSRLSRLRATGKPEAPLPASGSGKPGERVGKQAPAIILVQGNPPAPPPG